MNPLKLTTCLLIFILLAKIGFVKGQEPAPGLRFYAQNLQFTEVTKSQVTGYTLNFSLLLLENKVNSSKGRHPFLWIIIPLVTVLVMVLIGLFLVLKKARKRHLHLEALETIKKERPFKEEPPLQEELKLVDNVLIAAQEATSLEKEIEGTPIVEPAIGYIRPRVNAIWLIGKFVLFDKNGLNITHLCSDRIKSLFFLIFLSTLFDEGISPDKLSEAGWPGGDKMHSRKNRSDTINHLRRILEKMEGIALVYDKRNWKISFTGPVYIDLVDLYNKRADQQGNRLSVIGLYSLGTLLKDEKMVPLDKFKDSFNREALELLTVYGKEYFDSGQYNLCSEIANIIHTNFDALNEYALEMKLKALTRMGNDNKARQEYDNFCQRFKLLMNIGYTVPFHKLADTE